MLLLAISRRNIMAKGQQRKNKEIKKPKQEKKVIVPVGKFITAPKTEHGQKH